MQKHPESRVRVHIALAVLVLISISTAGMWLFRNGIIRRDAEQRLASAEKMFQLQLRKDADLMSGVIGVLRQNQRVQAAWLASDRKELLDQTAPLLDTLRFEHGIEHLSFHDTDRKNFLRVHRPDEYGDPINRSTMLGAVKSGQPAYGLEFDQPDGLTLNLVRPWQVDGRIRGYVELAKAIDPIIGAVHEALGAELFIAIDKKLLVRTNEKEPLGTLGRGTRNGPASQAVVTGGTNEKLFSQVAGWLTTRRPDEARPLETVRFGRRYTAGAFTFSDAGLRRLGEIVVLHDATLQQTYVTRFALQLATVCLFVGVAAFLLLHESIGRTERRHAAVHQKVLQKHDELERRNEKTESQVRALRASSESLQAQLEDSKAAERDAKVFARQIERLLGITRTSLAIVDSDISLLYVDPATEKAYGSPEGLKCHKYFVGRARQCVECGVGEALETKRRVVKEQTLPNENDVPIQIVFVPFQNDKGEWVVAEARMNVAGFDRGTPGQIKSEKRLRATLEKSEGMLKAILNSTADGILAVNEKGRITHASARFAEMWQIPRELAESGDKNTMLDYILGQLDEPEAFLAHLRDLFRKLYQTPETEVDTISFRDGRVVERVSSPIMREGQVAGRVWSFRDVTEQKRAEEERIKRERMQGVLEMAGAACHEFNQPLQAIVGYCDLLLMRADKDDPAYKDVEAIHKNVERVGMLTRKLQHITRYETQEYLGGRTIIDIDKASDPA